MNETKLEEFLRELTLSSVARNANGIENVAEVLYTIEAAVRSRRIVDCVQFEESWQEKLEGQSHPHHFINFKLAPEVCEAAFEEDIEVNELTWNLALPDVDAFEADERPETAYDWLMQGEIFVNVDTGDMYKSLTQLIIRDEQAEAH